MTVNSRFAGWEVVFGLRNVLLICLWEVHRISSWCWNFCFRSVCVFFLLLGWEWDAEICGQSMSEIAERSWLYWPVTIEEDKTHNSAQHQWDYQTCKVLRTVLLKCCILFFSGLVSSGLLVPFFGPPPPFNWPSGFHGVCVLLFLFRMTLLLGPPSAGKTTLLLALAGKLDSDLKVRTFGVPLNQTKMPLFL